MTRSPWYEALFAELVSDRKGESVQRERTRTQSEVKSSHQHRSHAARPGSSGAQLGPYDLADHVQRSLYVQVPGSSRHVAPDKRTSMLDWSEPAHTSYTPPRWPSGPSYATSDLPSIPLYPQEVPQHRPSTYTPGGFISPPRARSWQADASKSHGSLRPASCSPPKQSLAKDSQIPPRKQSNVPSARPASLQSLSNQPFRPPISTSISDPVASPARDSPSTPSVKANQCAGTTGAGKRCTRIVGRSKTQSRTPSPTKSSGNALLQARQIDITADGPSPALTAAALRQLDRRLSVTRRKFDKARRSPQKTLPQHREVESDEDDDFDLNDGHLAADDDAFEELPVYCFQHSKQTLEQPGTFIGQYYVEFAAWIPPHLPRETQLQLRHEISKPVSDEDIPGYIYVHEMGSQDLNASSTTFLKLGRSIRPVARLSQWRSQCPTRQPVVRDIFPLHPSHPLRLDATSASLKQHALISPSRMHGALSFASQGAPNHRRWERLCLIELAGVAALQAAQRGTAESAREQCKDCGKIHIEMFLVDKSAYEQEVRDLVLRWQRFVETTASQQLRDHHVA